MEITEISTDVYDIPALPPENCCDWPRPRAVSPTSCLTESPDAYTRFVRRLVGKAISIRKKEWTYVYRLYEDDELYSRKKGDDPHELHNLAARPEYQRVRAALREVFRWLVERADTIPRYNNHRNPSSLALADPYEQYVMREENCKDCLPYW